MQLIYNLTVLIDDWFWKEILLISQKWNEVIHFDETKKTLKKLKKIKIKMETTLSSSFLDIEILMTDINGDDDVVVKSCVYIYTGKEEKKLKNSWFKIKCLFNKIFEWFNAVAHTHDHLKMFLKLLAFLYLMTKLRVILFASMKSNLKFRKKN